MLKLLAKHKKKQNGKSFAGSDWLLFFRGSRERATTRASRESTSEPLDFLHTIWLRIALLFRKKKNAPFWEWFLLDEALEAGFYIKKRGMEFKIHFQRTTVNICNKKMEFFDSTSFLRPKTKNRPVSFSRFCFH